MAEIKAEVLRYLLNEIYKTVDESPKVDQVIEEIRKEGYDVMFFLEAIITLKKRDPKTFTEEDRDFLKAIKIIPPESK